MSDTNSTRDKAAGYLLMAAVLRGEVKCRRYGKEIRRSYWSGKTLGEIMAEKNLEFNQNDILKKWPSPPEETIDGRPINRAGLG